MSLTPLEIENLQFRKCMFGGYDRTEVERFLAHAARAIDEYVNRIDQLQRQLAQTEAELLRFRENEEHLKYSVILAQRTADELIAAARQRASTIEGEAALEADRLRHSLVDIRNEREQFEFAFHGLLSGFLRRLESGNTKLSGLAAAASVAPPASTAAPPGLGQIVDVVITHDPVLPSEPRTVPLQTPANAHGSSVSAHDTRSPGAGDVDSTDFERAISNAQHELPLDA